MEGSSVDLSPVLGGPLYLLLRRSRPSGDTLERLHRRVFVLTLVAWAPLPLTMSLLEQLLGRGGYLAGRSLDDEGQAYTERTMFAELHVRLPIKDGILLSRRLRTDLRWLGENPEFSNRWRYRRMAEGEFTAGRVPFVPYVNVEPCYDSRYDTVNRIRLIPGASVAWVPHFAIEGHMTYRYDSRSSATHVFALNVILHVFIDTSGWGAVNG